MSFTNDLFVCVLVSTTCLAGVCESLILGIYGYHNAGKTLFLEKLMVELKKKGISAAAVKHLGGHFEFDAKKDTGRLAKAGFDPVAGIAKDQLIIRMAGNSDLWSAVMILQLLSEPDVIFVEGFKNEPIPKIAVGEIKKLPGTLYRAEQLKQILQYIQEKVEEEKNAVSYCYACNVKPSAKKKDQRKVIE